MRATHALAVTLRPLRAALPLVPATVRYIVHGDAVTVLRLILTP